MKELNKLIEGLDIKFPVKYDDNGGYILDADGKMLCEVRGWGWIQYISDDPEEAHDGLGNLIAHALNNLSVDISEKCRDEKGTCRFGKDEIEVATDNAIAHAELWEGKMSSEREEGFRYGFSEAIGFLNNLGTKSGDSTDSVKDANQNGDNLQPANDWRTMESAPKDEEIEVAFDEQKTETCIAVWSERPVCMLGPVNGGFPAGWATAGGQTDSNLPLDTPLYWRSIPNNLDATHHPTEVSAGHQPKEGELGRTEMVETENGPQLMKYTTSAEPVSGERTGEEGENK